MNKSKFLVMTLASTMIIGNTQAMAANFADINDVPWEGAKVYINEVADAGLMVGTKDANGNSYFKAKDNVSYNETVQLAYAILQKNENVSVTSTVQNKWTSVMNGYKIPTWAHPAVSYSLETGIITISDLPLFMSDSGESNYATRQDVAVIFGRLLNEFGTLKTNPVLAYGDASSINAVAAPYVDLLTQLGVLTGDSAGNFNPKNNINRAEMAVVVSKSQKIVEAGLAGSVTSTVKSIQIVGSNTIIELTTTAEPNSFIGTASTPVLDGNSTSTISTIEIGDTVNISYKGQDITSVLITQRAEVEEEVVEDEDDDDDDREDVIEALYDDSDDEEIEVYYDGDKETYAFKNDDIYDVDLYDDGDEIDVDEFEDLVEDTYKILELTFDSDDEIEEIDVLPKLFGEFVEISKDEIVIEVAGEELTFEYEDDDEDNVNYEIDGDSEDYDEFEDQASKGDEVEFEIDRNDKDIITDINLLLENDSDEGEFYSISSRYIRIEVNGDRETFYFPDEDSDEVDFYINGKSKDFEDFEDEIEAGDDVEFELNKDDEVIKVEAATSGSDDDEVEGKITSFRSNYIEIEDDDDEETKYYYEDSDYEKVEFYYDDEEVDYDKAKEEYVNGDDVTLVLDNDEVVEVHIFPEDDSDVKSDESGDLDSVSDDYVKIEGARYDFLNDDADDVDFRIDDGDEEIDTLALLEEALEDDKKIEIEIDLNSNDEVLEVRGEVVYAEGIIASVDEDKIEIITNVSEDRRIEYDLANDRLISIEDNSYSDNIDGLITMFEDKKDDEEIWVEIELEDNEAYDLDKIDIQ